MKKCPKCAVVKDSTAFNKDKYNKDGLATRCRECRLDEKRAYLLTKYGVFTQLYNSMLANSKTRKHDKPTFTKKDLEIKYYNTRRFNIYYSRWLETRSKYDKPSFDRKDNTLGYSLDNICLTTFGRNTKKQNLIIKLARIAGTEYTHRKVNQLTLDGKFIKQWDSMSSTEVLKDVHFENVYKVCNGKRAVCGGFKWEYVTDGLITK